MALLLNIDTAIDSASICLAQAGNVLGFEKNEKQKDHAAWLHIAIRDLFNSLNIKLNTLDAVAVTGGPGSYTGLRIGMAAAKGICYSLNKPLINLNTLTVLANASHHKSSDLLCPMIDARRMEVFTALFNNKLEVVKEPSAMILDENSFEEILKDQAISFFGNGSNKFRQMVKNENAIFEDVTMDARSMVTLSEMRFKKREFADLAYAEPLYLKEFYSPAGKS